MARFLFCSFALVLLYPSGIDMYLVGLPHIARDLGASEAQLHIAFSAYLAGMASSMVFAGKIADKAGRQPVAIAGAIVFALASLLCSQAQNSTVFLAGRFIQGIGAGFVPKTLNTSVYDEVFPVENKDAFATGRALAREEGNYLFQAVYVQ